MGPLSETFQSKPKFTYDRIQQEVNAGRGLLVYEAKVYDVTKWMKIHPGGELVVWHMLGRDATDQILTNHSAEVLEKYMKCFYVGDVDKQDAKTATMVDRPLSMAFRGLHRKITEQGYFKTSRMFYVKLYSSIFAWLFASLFFLVNFGHTLWGCTVSGLLIAIFWHQSNSIMHDTGHNAISQNRHIDTAIGLVFSNMFTGLSIGWWKTTHFVHHLVTNHPEHDPHIQMLPFVAIATKFFESIYSTYHRRTLPFDRFAKSMVSIQHVIYIPMMALARFVMYKDSFVYIARKERGWKLELACLLFYWAYFIWLIVTFIPDIRLQVYYFFLPNLVLVVLLLQLYVSHNHMSVEPMAADEDYVTYQLRTTMDFHTREINDWVAGGLQFQTAHHFFPRLPRHNLRRVTELLKEFCLENKLTYTAMSFTEGNVKLLKHLKTIADQAKAYPL